MMKSPVQMKTHASCNSFLAPEGQRKLAGDEITGPDKNTRPRPGRGAGQDPEPGMSSTHLSLHYHLIFSTKDRIAYLQSDWRGRLHTNMGGIVRDLGGVPESIGGVEDHVHLLIGLRAMHCLADVLREIKSSSSKWVHEEMRKPLFSWQEGYGAFTVSPTQIKGLKNYIANQEKHHHKKTFQEEYLEFLKASGVEYDENYLW
jgi:REP element-mobilizing transposase RayT